MKQKHIGRRQEAGIGRVQVILPPVRDGVSCIVWRISLLVIRFTREPARIFTAPYMSGAQRMVKIAQAKTMCFLRWLRSHQRTSVAGVDTRATQGDAKGSKFFNH